jgi:hypothetical protein
MVREGTTLFPTSERHSLSVRRFVHELLIYAIKSFCFDGIYRHNVCKGLL